MHSRYLGYSMAIKSVAFTPSIVCFIVFFTLIIVYGRIAQERPSSSPTANAIAFTSHDGEQPVESPNNEPQRNIEEKQK